ncbi:MAG: hypothetical protein IPI87_00770 [Betaproteobacteria bacterium]|nr:hypothetical protein [Betaproteobacteria bacterium]
MQSMFACRHSDRIEPGRQWASGWQVAQSPPPPCWNVNVADLFWLFEPLPTVFENCDTVQVVVCATLGTVQVLVSASIVSRRQSGGGRRPAARR